MYPSYYPLPEHLAGHTYTLEVLERQITKRQRHLVLDVEEQIAVALRDPVRVGQIERLEDALNIGFVALNLDELAERHFVQHNLAVEQLIGRAIFFVYP